MPYVSGDVIEEVRSRNDIVDVVGQYVHLQKKGANYFGLCPFHSEKSASFSVSPDKQMYYCFGCGAGGNVFTFLMEYESLSFPEALSELAERAGMELPQHDGGMEGREEANRRTKLLAIQKDAAKYFYLLLRGERGRNALAYFRKRELSDETMQKFGLGYADQYSDDLYRHLKSLGYDDDLLKDSGLVGFDERRGGHDKFWNRAMFPIMDVRSRVIGFGGRVMGDGEPKYLNSPETPIFDKSRNLYGLHLARSTKKPQMLLCEGYMDVIALHQAGFDNAVASLGTSLTAGHASLLARYTKEVYLTYDSDGAGVKAALRAIPILKNAGIRTKVIDMRPYKDPDEFIKALDAKEYQKRIDAAENSFMYTVRMEEAHYDLGDPEGKSSFYNAVADMLCGFGEKLERDAYVDAVASKYLINASDLQKLVNRRAALMGMAGGTVDGRGSPYGNARDGAGGPGWTKVSQADGRPGDEPGYGGLEDGASGSGRSGRGFDGTRTKRRVDGIGQSQKLLLTWLIEDVGLFPQVGKFITAEDFTEEPYHGVAAMLFSQYENTGTVNPAQIVSTFEDEESQREAAGMFHATLHAVATPEERERALKETIERVKQHSIQQRSSALSPSDMDGLRRVIEEKRALEELGKARFTVAEN